MRPHTMEGEDQPRAVTSRGARRWSRKARGGSAEAVLIVLLALGGAWLYMRGRGGDPGAGKAGPATAPPQAGKPLSDPERAALVAAARAMREGQDPQEALTPEQRVDLDRVYEGITHSRFSFYEVAPALTVSILLKGYALAVYDSKRHADRPGVYDRAQAFRQAVEDAASAFERGDLKAAFAAINGAPRDP